jgi:hypothetical protein
MGGGAYQNPHPPPTRTLELDRGSGIVADAMATSADRDDRDEKDEAHEDEASADEKADKADRADKADKAAAPKASAKAARDDEDEEEDEDDEDEEEDEAPAAKAGAAKASVAKASAKPAKDEEEDEDDEDDEEEKPAPKAAQPRRPGSSGGARRSGRGPGAGRSKGASVQQGGGSLGKSVLLFFVIVIGLGVGFMVLGRETTQEQAKPKWSAGQTVDVEITLVRTDRQDLACAAADEVAGKHCAFEAANKPWSKGDAIDDRKVLKPYTTTEHIQFTAAGLWSDPAMAADKLPATRFSVKCKYKVEGNIKNMSVRWEQTGQWFPNNEWYAGTVSDCKISS